MNVINEQCRTCIFRPGNPMHLRSGRVKEMVDACIEHDVHIPCHEHMTVFDEWDDDEAVSRINPEDPICRGFYDRYPGVGQLTRIMARLGVLYVVDAHGNRLGLAAGPRAHHRDPGDEYDEGDESF
jgi:hypothetical protein